MVRAAHLAFLFALTSAKAEAQLVNPGFESDGTFSLDGWEWTCEPPTPVTDTPPGGGSWAVRNNMGNPDCSPNYLFQRIPFAQGGEHWTLAGWARIDTLGWDALPRMGFSSVNNGVFGLQNQIGNPAPYWSYVWIADTVHATAADTAVVLLQSGEGFLGAGWFDALELQPQSAQGLASLTVELHTYLSAEHVLYLSAGDQAIRSVMVHDTAGRLRTAVHRPAAPGSVAISTEHLGEGVYIVRALTDAGSATTRFVKQ